MLTMLTLDPNTLFYWNLSNNSKKRKFESSVVSQWANSTPSDTKPPSHASSTSKQPIWSAPSLTNQSTITVTLVHTSDIQKCQPKDNTMVSTDEQLYVDDIAILDRDEIHGEEQEEAVKSPLKGSGIWLGSKVSV